MRPQQPLSAGQQKAVLAVLAAALVYMRAYMSTGALRTGLPPEQCGEFNKLLNIVHNIPGMVDGTYALGFDEAWFTQALRAFDQRNGTSFAKTYADQTGSFSS
jgi:hypothetical protein